MREFTRLSVLFFSLIIFSAFALADEEMKVESKVGGTVQSWFSYQAADSASMGFGLRRVRVRWYGTINTQFRAFIQAELVSPAVLDARVEYHFSRQFNIAAGRFIGAGVRAGGLTSHSTIDIVERSRSANAWASGTAGADFRDFGIQAEAKTPSGDLTGRLWLHNGRNSLNVINRETTLSTAELKGIAADLMLMFSPKNVEELEIGGHYGIGNKDVKDLRSFSAYAYYEPGPLRLKAELISLTDKSGAENQIMLGYYVFGGYQITPNVELVGRFEPFDPNTNIDEDGTNYMTGGVVYKQFSGKVNHKLTAAVVVPAEQGNSVDNTTFYAVWQIVF